MIIRYTAIICTDGDNGMGMPRFEEPSDAIRAEVSRIYQDLKRDGMLSELGSTDGHMENNIIDTIANNVVTARRAGQSYTLENITFSMQLMSHMTRDQTALMKEISQGVDPNTLDREDLKEMFKNAFKNMIKSLDPEGKLDENKVEELAERFASKYVNMMCSPGVSMTPEMNTGLLREIRDTVRKEIAEIVKQEEKEEQNQQKTAKPTESMGEHFTMSAATELLESGAFALTAVLSRAVDLDPNYSDAVQNDILERMCAYADKTPELIERMKADGMDVGYSSAPRLTKE